MLYAETSEPRGWENFWRLARQILRYASRVLDVCKRTTMHTYVLEPGSFGPSECGLANPILIYVSSCLCGYTAHLFLLVQQESEKSMMY